MPENSLNRITTLSASQIFAGGGEMGEQMGALDWSSTPVGHPETWPSSLATLVATGLRSRFPIVLWWSRQHYTTFYNDAYIPVLGKTKHPGWLGRSGKECWQEIWSTIGPMLEGVFETGQPTWSEDLLLVLDRNLPREEGYFTFSYSAIPGAAGSVDGIFCAVAETTERVLSERRLRLLRDLSSRASEARSAEEACDLAAQLLGHNTADLPFALIYLLDHQRMVAQLVALSGVARGSAAAVPTIPLTQPPAPGIWPLAEAARQEQPTTVSLTEADFGVLPGGPWPESPGTALVLPLIAPSQHQVTGFLVAGVNPRRPLDEAYQDFFTLVAGHVATAVANARAYEEERRRAEALAALDYAKTAFFSNVSHEFRTPLTLMLGPLEDLLADNTLPPAAHAPLALIQRNGLRLLKLVNTLLDFSRIEAGRAQAVYVPTDLAALTSDLASVFRSLIEQAGLRLSIECPPLAEPVYVDREMWEKIVLNLLSNAFKFTFAGEIAVLLRQGEDQVELVVRDTGTGIPPEEVPRLFERFHRVQGVRSRTYEGSGIGLALVQELVHLHGGTIRVESQVDVGTSFSICLPLGTAHLAPERIQTSRPLASTALGTAPFVEEARRWLQDGTAGPAGEDWLRPDALQREGSLASVEASSTPAARILLADDNADLREYLTRLLSEHYEVLAVADGAAALAAAQAQPPDLVLSDVMMPHLDGFGLLSALHADPNLQTIPVILLSARAGEEATIEGLTAGANDYLVKPFSAREVLARIATHLEIARLRQQVAARALALDSANQEMSISLSLVGHELRTPLTSIRGQAQLLQRRLRQLAVPPIDSERSRAGDIGVCTPLEEGLERIEAQTRRMDRLVEDLLEATRVQTKSLDLRQEPYELGSLVEEAVAEQQRAWPERRLHLQMTTSDAVWVEIDGERIRQVLTNYLTNALKYAPPTRPVEIVLRQTGPLARVEVCDEGPGIPLQEQPRIWERFHRVPGMEAQSGSGGGLGLGLYLCKALIEGQGGQVGVESIPGQGSTFWFTLPLRAQHRDLAEVSY